MSTKAPNQSLPLFFENFSVRKADTDLLNEFSDETLMARFQNNCEQSFTLLMKRYQSQIYGFIYRFINDKDFAEDLTQEVFLRIYQRGFTFRLDAKFSTWLYRIARNLSIDFNKRQRQAPKLLLNTPPPTHNTKELPLIEQLSSSEPSAERHLLNEELKIHVENAIQKLPAKYKEVFLLCSIQRLSYEEAGHILNCSVKTVSSRLCRAKVKFMNSLEKYLHQGEEFLS